MWHELFVIVDGGGGGHPKDRHVATRGGGEFVGEIAVLEETPRMATVEAKTPLRVFG